MKSKKFMNSGIGEFAMTESRELTIYRRRLFATGKYSKIPTAREEPWRSYNFSNQIR